MRDVNINVNDYDACVLRSALKHYHTKVSDELDALCLSLTRELTDEERESLPPNLVDATRAQLAEQVDAWRSLQLIIEFWQKEFEL